MPAAFFVARRLATLTFERLAPDASTATTIAIATPSERQFSPWSTEHGRPTHGDSVHDACAHDSAMRSLPRKTWPLCAPLLAYAILFVGLRGRLPTPSR